MSIILVLQVAPVATDTLNVVKEKVAEAAHVGIEKTQEVYNDYVAPTAAAGKNLEQTLSVNFLSNF